MANPYFRTDRLLSLNLKFSDKALEQQWAIEYNRTIQEEFRPMVLIVGVLFFLFFIPDYFTIKSPGIFLLITLNRSLFFAVSVLLYLKANYFLSIRLPYLTVTFYEIIGSIVFFVITYNYPSPNFLIQSIGLIVMVLGIFFVLPNLLVLRITTALFISLGFTIITILKFTFTWNEFSAVIIFLLIILSLSTLSSYRLYKYQRLNYLHKKTLMEISVTDPLTGIYNRLQFNSSIAAEINMAKRFGIPFSLVMFDVDWFKKINDKFGHIVGDDILVKICQLVKNAIRNEDIFARWGGEEFIILLRNTGRTDAAELADRLRLTVAHYPFITNGVITCSFGVTVYIEGDDLTSLIERADKALYKAKETGRNRVIAT